MLFACITLQFFAVQHQLDHFSENSQGIECQLCSHTNLSDDLEQAKPRKIETIAYTPVCITTVAHALKLVQLGEFKHCRAPPSLLFV